MLRSTTAQKAKGRKKVQLNLTSYLLCHHFDDKHQNLVRLKCRSPMYNVKYCCISCHANSISLLFYIADHFTTQGVLGIGHCIDLVGSGLSCCSNWAVGGRGQLAKW